MKRKFISFFLVIILFSTLSFTSSYGTEGKNVNDTLINKIDEGLEFIVGDKKSNQRKIEECLIELGQFINEYESEKIDYYFSALTEEMVSKNYGNVEYLSNCLVGDRNFSNYWIDELVETQNPDGGFGLASGYESDIIDSKAALKALQVIEDTEAMERTIDYIVSCQNDDGGFPYQPGLESDAELTADIGNILADCVKNNNDLKNNITPNLILLRKYLDKNAVELSELGSDNLNKVYQHFNTALFKLKMDKEYDITPYYDLQEDNGSVYDDALATAMYLELLVLEENTIKADISDMSLLTDDGKAASVYNSHENVNIVINSNYDKEEGRLKIEIETPEKEIISVNKENDKWLFNTGKYQKGTYKVSAKIINKNNDKIAASYSKYFNINPKFSLDGLDIYFARQYYDYVNYGPPEFKRTSFAHKGETGVYPFLIADVQLNNLKEATDDIVISWELKRKTKKESFGKIVVSKRDGKYMFDGSYSLDDLGIIPEEDKNKWKELELENADPSDVFSQEFILGTAPIDTTESCTYVLQTEVSMGDEVLKSGTANFIVSGQEMSLVTNTDKDELVAQQDSANVNVKLREKKTVDIVLASKTDDINTLNKYADKIHSIEDKMNKLGYSVNVGATTSTYYTAKDTFAWQEFDHINYIEEPSDWYETTNFPKHIIYDGNDIRMVGYNKEAMKDFLLVEGTDETRKELEFDVVREDDEDWHTLDGAGFLFNTSIEDGDISGYCVLLNSNSLNVYRIFNKNLDDFRNGRYSTVAKAGYKEKGVSIDNPKENHHIKVVVEDDYAKVYDNGKLVISNAYVGGNYNGNMYGPITSYQSHCCGQISSFRFSNIKMKEFGGKSLLNATSNFNYESYDSRYIVDVSDIEDEDLIGQKNQSTVGERLYYNNITLLTVGSKNNKSQFEPLYEGTIYDGYEYIPPINGKFFDISDENSLEAIEEYIISREEGKYIIDEKENKATDLVFTGKLHDGSIYKKKFEHLYEGEQISIDIPQIMDDLVVGQDTPILTDVSLTYKDALGEKQTVSCDDIYLPVTQYTKKIDNRLTTDKDEYKQYSNSEISCRIYNKSEKYTGKNLVSVIAIKDTDGKIIENYSKELPEVMLSSEVDHNVIWNIGESDAGDYIIEASVYDGTYLVTQKSKTVVIKELDKTYVNLSGNITLSKKILKNTDELVITKKVKNEFKKKIDNVKELVKVINVETNEAVYESETLMNLEKNGENTTTETVIAKDDFSNAKNGEYYISHEVELEDGTVLELEGDGFILDTQKKTDLKDIFGSGTLISLNKEAEKNGIELDGAIITVDGTMHSNTNIEVNTSILNVSDICEAVLPLTFNAVIKNITNGTRVCGSIDVPDAGCELCKDDILIESPIYDNYSSSGKLLASEGNITIRSSYARFKGLIYAPNGTVTIESSTFNMEGRIVAKNIIYRGSVLNVSSYDGDLELLK